MIFQTVITALTEYYWIQPGLRFELTREHYWDVSSASTQRQIEMSKQIKICHWICTLFMIQSTINSVFGFFIGFHSDIRSDLHSIEILCVHHKFLIIIPHIILNIAHSIVTLISISIYLILKYMTTMSKIQLQLLTDYLEKVGIYGKRENEAITKHMKICSSHHSLLLE